MRMMKKTRERLGRRIEGFGREKKKNYVGEERIRKGRRRLRKRRRRNRRKEKNRRKQSGER